MAYTTVFDGSPVQPADVSYAAYTLSAANPNIDLNWPASGLNTTNVVARKIDISVSDGDATYSLTMPDARAVSPGTDVLFFNKSAYDFNVLDNDGNVICNVPVADAGGTPPTSGTEFITLTDNTTNQGTWDVVSFGALTGSIQASALAGDGLTTLIGNTKLNIMKQVSPIDSPGYTIQASDRGKLLVYSENNGTGVVNLPVCSDPDIGDGFWFAINNESQLGGQLEVTAQPGSKIDVLYDSYALSQEESGFFVTDGDNWFTLGTGKQTFFSASVLNLEVPSSGTRALTTDEALNNIQQYTSSGDLVGDVTVLFPRTSAQYYISNGTTGAHDLYIQLQGITGSKTLIPQSEKVIVYTDAASFYIVPTVAQQTTTNMGQVVVNTAGIITTGNPGDAVTNGDFYDIPGLVASPPYPLSDSSNDVLVTVTTTIATDLAQPDSYLHFKIVRSGSVDIGLPSAAGSRTLSLASVPCDDSFVTCSFSYLDSPGVTAPQTYQVQVASTSSTPGASHLYFNQSSADTNNAYNFRCISTITVTEYIIP